MFTCPTTVTIFPRMTFVIYIHTFGSVSTEYLVGRSMRSYRPTIKCERTITQHRRITIKVPAAVRVIHPICSRYETCHIISNISFQNHELPPIRTSASIFRIMVIDPRAFRKMLDHRTRSDTTECEPPVFTAGRVLESHRLGKLRTNEHGHRGVRGLFYIIPTPEMLWEWVNTPDHVKPGKGVVRAGLLSEPDQVLYVKRTKLIVIITEENPICGDPVQRTLPRDSRSFVPVVRGDVHLIHGVALPAHARQSAVQQLGTGRNAGDRHSHSRIGHSSSPYIRRATMA